MTNTIEPQKCYFIVHQNSTQNQNHPYKIVIWRFVSAIGAEVLQLTDVVANATLVRVMVTSILLRGAVHLQTRRPVELWAAPGCVCPKLQPGRRYLIVGREDVLMNRLLFRSDSMVSKWNDKWESKLKVSKIATLLCGSRLPSKHWP